MTDRGQSATVGFVVIFSMVLLMVALISVSGFATLDHVQDAERVNNGVRSFEILSDNVDDVVGDEVPSRTTTVKLYNSQLSAAETTTIEVAVPADDFTHRFEVTPIVLDAGTGTEVVYENGAVIRSDPDGQVMVDSPTMLLTTDYTVIPVVRTTPVGSTSVAGQTSATVRTTHEGTTVLRTDTESDDVTLTVTSPRSEAWLRYLDAQPGTDTCNRVASDTVSCTLDTSEVTVSVTDIAVRFDN
ncbi:hypothetical protein ACFQJ5_10750 [Halomicroarcula sp. GCM10025324]|uniref:DUF7289 family protein n=1 Tax=Haloarcula TaxID=2237 RepID=UPI0023E78630|nr:hypothetical protein [Halomicroarcula sp. ZS-22-S1]